jgi:hypothetical protein
MTAPHADATPLDRDFADRWYQGWLTAWNDNRPELCRDLVTEDFVLATPTTGQTGSLVQGPEAAGDYIRWVLRAYPDLTWEMTAPPMFADDVARATYSWRGTGTFTGRLDPPGVDGTGRAFEFSGVEVFDFRGDRACRLNAVYDLLGLMKQTGVHRSATNGR